jgi:class 3 adenylate cyclase
MIETKKRPVQSNWTGNNSAIQSDVPSKDGMTMDAVSHANSVAHKGKDTEAEVLRWSKQWWLNVFNNNWVVAGFTLATFFALFGDDLRVSAAPKEDDDIFYGLTALCIFLFAAEYIVFCICKPTYIWSFFFWLDLVALLSLLPDVKWLWDPIMILLTGSNSAEDNEEGLDVARAGRASRSGAKAGRVVRFIRIIRLFRVVKLYKYFGKKKQDDDEEEDEEDFSSEMSGSSIGNKLQDNTTRGVIIGVLLMLFALPLLEVAEIEEGPRFGLLLLQSYSTKSDFPELDRSKNGFLASEIDVYRNQWADVLVRLRVDGETYVDEPEVIAGLRTDTEMIKLIVDKNAEDNEYTEAWVSQLSTVQWAASLNMILTGCVMIILGTGSFLFSNDAEKIVIRPIKDMVKFVQKINKDPMSKIDSDGMYSHGKGTETSLLQATLMKLAGLLQVGFGEAGSEIISNNLDGDTVDPMVAGQKVYGVYGFIDIRLFDEVNKCLGEQIMPFVNTLADIIHSSCDRYSGAANKNIGNAFLMVWKFPPYKELLERERLEAEASLDKSDPEAREHKAAADALAAKNDLGDGLRLLPKDICYRESMRDNCNQALIAFLEVILRIYTTKKLANWKVHPKILAHIPDYKLKLGFGLHAGWAIEGAIGSAKKIDASYLSPNVNMAARLESASNIYGLDLLFSQPFYDLLSPAVHEMTRLVDTVTVKGSLVPMNLYTFDVFLATDDVESDDEEEQAGRRGSKGGIGLGRKSHKESINGRGSIMKTSLQRRYSVDMDGDSASLPPRRRSKSRHDSQDNHDGKAILLNALNKHSSKRVGSLGVSESVRGRTPRAARSSREIKSKDTKPSKRARPDGQQIGPEHDAPEIVITAGPSGVGLSEVEVVEALKAIQLGLPSGFVATYNQATRLYKAGDWAKSRAYLLECQHMVPEDGASKEIMDFMKETDFVAPSSWKGFRPLNRKR